MTAAVSRSRSRTPHTSPCRRPRCCCHMAGQRWTLSPLISFSIEFSCFLLQFCWFLKRDRNGYKVGRARGRHSWLGQLEAGHEEEHDLGGAHHLLHGGRSLHEHGREHDG